MKAKIYVGRTAGRPSEIFRSENEPTFSSHGDKFNCVIGPFRTIRGAKWMADPIKGQNNPHCRCVADAERLAARYSR